MLENIPYIFRVDMIIAMNKMVAHIGNDVPFYLSGRCSPREYEPNSQAFKTGCVFKYSAIVLVIALWLMRYSFV